MVGSATASTQGDVLTVTSGAFATYFNVTFTNSTVSWPNGAFFHLGFPTTFDTNSRLTGSGGVVATSMNTGPSYTLAFTNTPNGGNTFTGGLFANGNATVTFTQNNQANSSPSPSPAPASFCSVA